MRLSNKLCDVTVRVEDRDVLAHKVILAANLKYFESMFLNSFQESQQDIVIMKDVDAGYLEAFITYAYTGEILLTKSNALDLLEVADYLNEDIIKKVCIDFLEKNLDVSDAFRAYKFANVVECISLKNIAKSRIQSNFKDFSQSPEYRDLDFEILRDMLNGFKFENEKSLQLLFEGIMRWIMHDAINRKIRINDLLRLIDITTLTTGYLMNYLGSMTDLIVDDNGILKDIISYYYRCNKSQQMKLSNEGSAKVLMLLDDFDEKRFAYLYNFTERKWFSLLEIPDDRGSVYCDSVVLHDRLYYVGSNSGIFNLEVFDPTTKRITTSHRSSDISQGWAMCACSRYIYLCGGREEDDSVSDQVLRYDPQTNSFEQLTPMGTKRSDTAAVFYQGCLYVLGGDDDSQKLSLVEKYDLVTNEWMECPPMTEPRSYHAAAVLNGKMYSCGGEDTNSVEVYDSAKNSWKQVASMNKTRECSLLITREGKLWAIGGDAEITVEVYDPSKDQWQMDHEMSLGLKMRHPAGGLITSSCIFDTK